MSWLKILYAFLLSRSYHATADTRIIKWRLPVSLSGQEVRKCILSRNCSRFIDAFSTAFVITPSNCRTRREETYPIRALVGLKLRQTIRDWLTLVLGSPGFKSWPRYGLSRLKFLIVLFSPSQSIVTLRGLICPQRPWWKRRANIDDDFGMFPREVW